MASGGATDRVSKWKSYGNGLKRTASLSSVGLELGLAVGLGYLIGDYVDGKLDTAPWGMIVFIVVGSAAGFLSLYRALKRIERQSD